MADGCNILEMNYMKKIFITLLSVLALSAAFTGCSKKNDPDVTGGWKLDDMSIVTRGETFGLNVYLLLSPDGVFDIWQQLQAGRYYHYSGSWTKNGSTIQGIYSDGKLWGAGAYEASVSDAQLVLKAKDGSGEVTTYVRTAVPEDVRANAVEALEQ